MEELEASVVTELVGLLDLRDCSFEGVPVGRPLPRLERNGAISGATEHRFSGEEFTLPPELELPVLGRGRQLGRFVLVSDSTSRRVARGTDRRSRARPTSSERYLRAKAPQPRLPRLSAMSRGTLRVYLGAAPGVGKTFAMLNEGRRRADRGTDVVVGLVESHGRALTEGQIGDLEVVPRRTIDYRGAEFTEMDVDAVLARKPAVVLVDELAHSNVPGSRNEKRWQDVGELLDAGIDVISTVNIQHLESVNDVVERITGVKQQETIPDEIVRAAEQVELVDMTPEALRRRMAHGNIYPPERIDTSLANYFRLGNLAALREIALLWVADKVEESLQQYLEDHGIEGTWETRERVVVALTGAPGGDVLIRRAARMARRVQGDLLGVHVRPSDGLATSSSELLQKHRRLLADVGGSYHELAADDVADGIGAIRARRARHATGPRVEQAVALGAPHPRFGDHGVLRAARDLDVHVISTAETEDDHATSFALRRGATGISKRRRLLALGGAVVALPLLTLLLAALRQISRCRACSSSI